MEPQEILTRINKAASKAVVTHLTAAGRDSNTVKKAHASYIKQAARRGDKYSEMMGALVGEEA